MHSQSYVLPTAMHILYETDECKSETHCYRPQVYVLFCASATLLLSVQGKNCSRCSSPPSAMLGKSKKKGKYNPRVELKMITLLVLPILFDCNAIKKFSQKSLHLVAKPVEEPSITVHQARGSEGSACGWAKKASVQILPTIVLYPLFSHPDLTSQTQIPKVSANR